MHLPSFIWLWKIAAWSMGFSLLTYSLLAVTGMWMFRFRTTGKPPFLKNNENTQVRRIHFIMGISLIIVVLLLLAIGLVGTVGHFGSLGQSSHLFAGLLVVTLVLLSGFSATQIQAGKPWARALHIRVNICLCIGFLWVSYTGWNVVQKYLP